MHSPSSIDVAILCGGLGKRLRPIISDRPKPMAEIGRRPFLDILIDYMKAYGFRRFILCAGYRADFIEQYYTGREGEEERVISKEETPLGTAGALRNAEPFLKSDLFICTNGDSFCRIDLKDFLNFHVNKGACASIVLSRVEGSRDYGVVVIDEGSRRVEGFCEKSSSEETSIVNAGIYAFTREIFDYIPRGKRLSLEYDVFPRVASDGRLYGYITDECLLDIGTPERFRMAERMLGR